jgi:hypothetical protein
LAHKREPAPIFVFFPTKQPGANDHVIAQHNAGFDNGVAPIATLLPSFAVGSITALARYPVPAAAWYQEFEPCAHRSGRDYALPARRYGQKEIILRHHNGRSLASGQVFTVLRVDHESNMPALADLHGRNAGDDDIAITV